jgi:hypothetical protein
LLERRRLADAAHTPEHGCDRDPLSAAWRRAPPGSVCHGCLSSPLSLSLARPLLTLPAGHQSEKGGTGAACRVCGAPARGACHA